MKRQQNIAAPFSATTATPRAVGFGAIDLVMFDMDGTLTDTVDLQHAGWGAAVNPILKAHGQPPLTREECLVHLNGQCPEVGIPPLLKARGLDKAAVDLDAIGEVKSRFSKEWLAAPGNAVGLHEDVVALARSLRGAGKTVAVVSSSRSARQMLDKLGILGDFDYVMCGSLRRAFNLAAKPAPDTLEYTRQHFEKRLGRAFPAGRCAMVGDTSADIRAARAMGAGLVVGFNPELNEVVGKTLRESGADVVYTDMRDALPLLGTKDARPPACPDQPGIAPEPGL